MKLFTWEHSCSGLNTESIRLVKLTWVTDLIKNFRDRAVNDIEIKVTKFCVTLLSKHCNGCVRRSICTSENAILISSELADANFDFRQCLQDDTRGAEAARLERDNAQLVSGEDLD